MKPNIMNPKCKEERNQHRIKEYMQGAKIVEVHFGYIADVGHYAEIVLDDGAWLYVDKDDLVLSIPKENE